MLYRGPRKQAEFRGLPIYQYLRCTPPLFLKFVKLEGTSEDSCFGTQNPLIPWGDGLGGQEAQPRALCPNTKRCAFCEWRRCSQIDPRTTQLHERRLASKRCRPKAMHAIEFLASKGCGYDVLPLGRGSSDMFRFGSLLSLLSYRPLAHWP